MLDVVHSVPGQIGESLSNALWSIAPRNPSAQAFISRYTNSTLGHRLDCAGQLLGAADAIQNAVFAANSSANDGVVNDLRARQLSAAIALVIRHQAAEMVNESSRADVGRAELLADQEMTGEFCVARIALRDSLPRGVVGLCDRALEQAASGCWVASAGAEIYDRASSIAERAWISLDSAQPQAINAYGPAAKETCVRDLRMLVAAAGSALSSTSPLQDQRAWLHWVFDSVGRYVDRYSASMWRSTFASVLCAGVEQLPWQSARVLTATMIGPACTDADPRRALHVFVLAPEIAREAAMACISDPADSGQAAIYADAFADLLRFAAVELGVGNTGLASGIAEFWLQTAGRKLPFATAQEVEAGIRTLHSSSASLLAGHYTEDLDLLLRIAIAAARQLAEVSSLLTAIPAASSAVVDSAFDLDAAQTDCAKRWFSLLLTRAIELSCRGDYSLTAVEWWRWVLDEANPVAELTLQTRGRLIEHLGSEQVADALAGENDHLRNFLEDIAASADRYSAALGQRENLSYDSDAGTTLQQICVERLLFCLLLPEEEGLCEAEATRFVAEFVVPLLKHNGVDNADALLTELRDLIGGAAKQIAAIADDDLGLSMDALHEQLGASLPLLANAGFVFGHGQSLANALVEELFRDGQSNRLAKALKTQCRRDLAIVLRTAAVLMAGGGPGVFEDLRKWSEIHLLPFLEEPTLAAIARVGDYLSDGFHGLTEDQLVILRKVFGAVYRLREGLVFGDSQSLANALVEELFRDGQSNPLAEESKAPCRRDLTIVLRTAEVRMADGGPSVFEDLSKWSEKHLLPFLEEPTLEVIARLDDCLTDGFHDLTEDQLVTLRKVFAAVYRLEVGSVFGGSKSLADALVEALFRDGQSNPLAEDLKAPCRRDLTIVLRNAEVRMADGGHGVFEDLRKWSKIHLLPFLEEPTMEVIARLDDCLSVGFHGLTAEQLVTLRKVFAAVYRLEGGSVFGDSKSLANALVEALFSDGQSNPLADQLKVQCRRDLRIVLRTAEVLMSDGGPDVFVDLREWSETHLLPFLEGPTLQVITGLSDCLSDGFHDLTEEQLMTLREVFTAVYRLPGSSVFGNSKSLANALVEALSREGQSNPLAEGSQARCRRDLTIVLRNAEARMSEGGPGIFEDLRSWSKIHLLPFLEEPTLEVIARLGSCLTDGFHDLTEEQLVTLRKVFATVYRLDGGSVFGDGKSLANALVEELFREGQSNPLAEQVRAPCRRDLMIVLRTAEERMSEGGPGVFEDLGKWSETHLLPFLKEPTLEVIGRLVDCLADGFHDLTEEQLVTLRKVFGAVYRLQGA